MRIAIISNNFFQYDAIGKYIQSIIKALPEAHFDLYLETNANFPQLPENTRVKVNYFIKRLPCLAWYMLEWKIGKRIKLIETIFNPLRNLIIYFLAQSILKKKYDFVFLQWGLYFNGLYLFQALAKIRKNKKPILIFDYHGTTPSDFIDSPGKKMIAKRSMEELHKVADKADLCLVRSEFIQKELQKYANPKKIVILHLPIFKKKNILTVQQPSKSINLLYVGRIAKHKNLEIVLKAISILQNSNISFNIIGNFSRPSLRAEKQRLETVAQELKVYDKINFIGEVKETELEKYYQNSQIFIIPSLHEGFCWPAVEALAYALPVIYSNTGALPEIINSAGLSFNPDDAQDLAKKISILINNTNLQEELKNKGLQKARQYNWRSFKEKLVFMLEEPEKMLEDAINVNRVRRNFSSVRQNNKKFIPIKK